MITGITAQVTASNKAPVDTKLQHCVLCADKNHCLYKTLHCEWNKCKVEITYFEEGHLCWSL
jgi:hypothetical protein